MKKNHEEIISIIFVQLCNFKAGIFLTFLIFFYEFKITSLTRLSLESPKLDILFFSYENK